MHVRIRGQKTRTKILKKRINSKKSDQQRISRREPSRNIGKDWWTIMKENNDRMPPIKNTNIQIPTRSECSSQFSGFRSTPETNLTQCQSDILTNVSTDEEKDISIPE